MTETTLKAQLVGQDGGAAWLGSDPRSWGNESAWAAPPTPGFPSLCAELPAELSSCDLSSWESNLSTRIL